MALHVILNILIVIFIIIFLIALFIQILAEGENLLMWIVLVIAITMSTVCSVKDDEIVTANTTVVTETITSKITKLDLTETSNGKCYYITTIDEKGTAFMIKVTEEQYITHNIGDIIEVTKTSATTFGNTRTEWELN